jgi:hypothetical protein
MGDTHPFNIHCSAQNNQTTSTKCQYKILDSTIMLYKKKEQGETAVLSFFISTSYDMVQTMSSLTLPRSSLLQGGLPPVGEASCALRQKDL